MRINALTNRVVAIMAVLLLIFSYNISFNASANYINDDSYGVWYDDFDDDGYLTIDDVTSIDSDSSYRCALNDTLNCITLSQGSNCINYDSYNTKDNVQGWEFWQSLITIDEYDNLGLGTNLILNPGNVGSQINCEEFNSGDLDDIGIDDDNYVQTMGWHYRELNRILNPIHYFRFTVDEDPDLIENIEISWRYGDYYEDAYLEKLLMFVWTYDDLLPHWSLAKTIPYNEEKMNDGIVDLRFTNDIYISDEGEIDFFIIGKSKPENEDEDLVNSFLRTDYVNVSVEIGEGYLPDGNIISEVIEPSQFKGWETLFWDGSKPSSKTNIKIKILDEDSNPISDSILPNNEEGFTTSPIDLSVLGNSYSKIRVQALLHTEDLGYTPYLYKWGLMWQTQDGFYDSFSYDFRIEESYGVEFDAGNIIISEFYGDWPILGKNPANTRSYVGIEAKEGSNTTYWHSSTTVDVGRGLRSPVVSKGRVYISSVENKIYAFNVTVPETGKKQKPVDSSDDKFVVDASLAVSGDYLIVATSDKNAGANNKIYALNTNDLTQEKWIDPYPKGDSENICFSSAPTIANGRVFATSWSGMFWNNPLITQIYEKINSLLGLNLGQNNKLIVLDLASGKPIWDPVDLPAASYSTPAVDNGVIYVGCENRFGGSILAFDETTGDELWNKSIGLIGKSSPVVAQTDNGKAVFVLSREQELFALKGNDKLFALDAEDGEELWNITLSENSSVLSNILKIGRYEEFALNNLLATSSPISSVAVQGNTLVTITSQGLVYAFNVNNGEEIWNFDASSGSGLDNLFPNYYSASPVIVNNVVYIASEQGTLFALDLNSGEVVWEYKVEYYGVVNPPKNYIFAPPVVSDGLTYISAIEKSGFSDPGNGKLYCIGDFETNNVGKVISKPIHVQKGKWWDVFNASTQNTGENKIITFSILDENNNPLSGFENLDGDDNDISGISTNTIKLSATLETNETEPHPILNEWSIEWTTEAEPPVFIDSSFEPGEDGWINQGLPECSIEAYDVADGDLLSGIDTSSGRYELEYLEEGEDTPTTKWFDAVCDDESGVRQARIRAEIESDLEGVDISKLLNITFKISDQAGNEETSDTVTFRIDTKKPTSYFTSEFETTYTDAFDITADAEDEGDAEGASGVSTVALKYRNSTDGEDWNDWDVYQVVSSPFSWSFETDDSGYYKLVTIATDKASNEEDYDSDKVSDTFLFDMTMPEMEPIDDVKTLDAPSFDIEISDDFALDALYYRTQDETSWTKIKSDIGDQTYSTTWNVPEDIWLDIIPELKYFIHFKIVDLAGNEYDTSKDGTSPYITKDENITKFYVDVGDFAEWNWDDKFTITATVPDEVDVEAVTLYYRYSADEDEFEGVEWIEYGTIISEPYEWEFVAEEGDGFYEFYTETEDTEGVTYQSQIESAKVSIFPTSAASIMILLLLLVVLVTIFVLRKMKKKEKE